MRRLRGTTGLVFDGIDEITNLVERTTLRVAERATDAVSIARPLAPAANTVRSTHGAITSVACASVRTISRGVEVAVDAGLDLAEVAVGTPEAQESDVVNTVPWAIDQAEGVLNGVLGDYLATRENTLALAMTLRHRGIARTPAEMVDLLETPTPFLCVFVHGLVSTEWCWSMQPAPYEDAEDTAPTYASLLARDLGATPLFVRYNTGQAIVDNGRALAALLEELVAVYPVPIERIALVGHSMGGLVSRVAAAHAHHDGLAWSKSLDHIICLGSPHHGAPLERVAKKLRAVLDFADVAATRVIGEVLGARSVGIHDLGDGVHHEVPDVRLSVVASSVTADTEDLASEILGDLLVPVSSASGAKLKVDDVARFGSINHLQLTNHPQVYPVLRGWLER